MSKDELIAKQQLEIEDYKQRLQENKAIVHDIQMKFYGVGQPLNDNVLKMNHDQLVWCIKLKEMVDQINFMPA